MNVYEYLTEHAQLNDPAVLSRRESVTYGTLLQGARRVGDMLVDAGVAKGQRVGILAENSAHWVACYLGILRSGAVAVPFPARLGPQQLTNLARLTECRALCVDSGRAGQQAQRLLAELAMVTPAVTALDAGAAEPTAEAGGIDGPATAELSAVTQVDDTRVLAALMFTSGSTGAPNAVKVSHRNIIANTSAILEYLGLARDDRMMVLLPFDYCFGLSLLHTHLRVGGSLVLNNASQFAEDVLDDMEQFACTGFAGVPAIYQHLLRRSSLPRRALPHLRHAQQAGGKLADALIIEFRQAVPHVRFFVMYGQTEATSRLSYLPPERIDDKLGSIGRGVSSVCLQVLNARGKPVRPGSDEIGEIVATGESVTLGYCQPDTAKNSFRRGKLYTGDLARVDADGFIYLVGRTSDFIKPSGHRISSKEIEDLLAELPEVVEAAVVGVPDPDLGEAVKAYLVTCDGRELAYKRVADHCRGRLPAYAIPRTIAYLPSLPKNGSQKVLKQALPA